MPLIHPRYGFDRYSSVRIAYGPSFAPDGQHVSFISDITGVPQAWILDLATSRIDQLTLFNERVSLAVFSPTGQNLGLSMDPGGGERHQVWTLDMENLAAKKLTVGDDWIRVFGSRFRSEEHTSELQSLRHLVCRLLLEKKKREIKHNTHEQVIVSR